MLSFVILSNYTLSSHIIDLHHLPPSVLASVSDLEISTQKCTGFLLNVCLSYGSRAEILEVCRSVAMDASCGRLHPDDVTEAEIGRRLLTGSLPGSSTLVIFVLCCILHS